MEPRKQPNPLRWGIMATGGIARTFVNDLILPPTDRDAPDVAHKIVAVASSTSQSKAQDFIDQTIVSGSDDKDVIRAYGTYEELVNDDNIEIVYVATPQSRHYEDVLSALRAGKHVCCEKPMTINAAQTEHLIKVAREKSLFLTEALWTLFFPLVKEVRRILHVDRTIGRIDTIRADFSLDFTLGGGMSQQGWHHRIYQPSLGGGALLDLGIYPLTWAFLALFDDPLNAGIMPKVNASMMMTRGEGEDGWNGPVDEHTAVVLTFEELHATAVLTSSLSVKTPYGQAVVIQGTKGDMTIPWTSYRPESIEINIIHAPPNIEQITFPIPGTGLFWEADVCYRCIRSGKLETEECPLEKSVATMRILDEVRRLGGFQYPGELEKLVD